MIQTSFLMVSVRFWVPFGSHFLHWWLLFWDAFSHYVPRHLKDKIVSIFAYFSEVFPMLVKCLLEAHGHSDFCTPFNEKQLFLRVPGL